MNYWFTLLVILFVCSDARAWLMSLSSTTRTSRTELQRQQQPRCSATAVGTSTRRDVLVTSFSAAAAAVAISTTTFPLSANALVKGNAPPPSSKSGGGSSKPKCTNIDDCLAMAEQKQLQEESAMAKGPPPQVTSGGTRYIDMEDSGSRDASSTPTVAKNGDRVTINYKVLKLGKRSYDGLSGEGTVVFSRGYGLEDDETAPGIKSFQTVVGDTRNIAALNDGIVGMHVGGTRRLAVLPQKGWEKPLAMCDGGPGGKGAGGDLKTDYVIVPTATMVATEECFDKTKLPFPTSYAEERRMAQRFDQSLIMEVQLASID